MRNVQTRFGASKIRASNPKMSSVALIALMMLSVSGCGIAGPQSEFCAVARKPIPLPAGQVLPRPTEDGILYINEKGAELCGWKPYR